MSVFGENYQKNDLVDNIQYFFSEGGTLEGMFDVLKYVFEYGKGPFDELTKENQELKKQLEEKDTLIKQCELSVSNVMDCYCERTDCAGRIKDSKTYDSLVQKVENQQKEFIEYLENMLDDENDIFSVVRVKDVLQKYKEIIGD